MGADRARHEHHGRRRGEGGGAAPWLEQRRRAEEVVARRVQASEGLLEVVVLEDRVVREAEGRRRRHLDLVRVVGAGVRKVVDL